MGQMLLLHTIFEPLLLICVLYGLELLLCFFVPRWLEAYWREEDMVVPKSRCVCAQKYYIFPPPPFFFGSCTTFGFQKLQHCCCYLLHIFWHTGILDGMVVGFYGLEGAQWYTIMVTFHRGSHWNIHLTLWMGNVGWMILEKTFGNYSGIKLPQN